LLKTKNINAIFYAHILRSNLRQTTKFHSIIPNFDKVTPYYARSPSEFFRFRSQAHCADFIAKYEWPPKSPDLNPLDYCVWGAMQCCRHFTNL